MADWYYAKGGKQFGPISAAELKQKAQAGELTPDDLVFQEGGTQWVAASTVKGLFGGGPPIGGGSAPPPGRGVTSRDDEDRGAGSGYPPDDRDRDRDRGGYGAPSPRGEASPPGERSTFWLDVLMFRRLNVPTLSIILFWINVAIVLISSLVYGIIGLATLFSGRPDAAFGLLIILGAILYIPFGILVVRLYCEMLIVIFRMYESLLSINENMERQKKEAEALR